MCGDHDSTPMQETNDEVRRLRDRITNGQRGSVLVLNHETYTEFPLAVLELTELHELYLAISNISSLPSSIRVLENLSVLDLRANDFETFPEAICSLKNLEVLDLSENKISTIPEDICNLGQLKRLNLKSNKLEGELSRNISSLKNLEHFNGSTNAIRTIPDCFENLTELKHLFLSRNALNTAPGVLQKLTELRVLDISYNDLREFSLDLSNLKVLENLDLESTNLSALNDSAVCSITSLQRLDLGLNKLENIPVSFNQLINLKALWLNHNNLTRFPEVICELRSLETLSISYNNIGTVPWTIAYLNNLKMLELDKCGLNKMMPLSICMLRNLKLLSLADNDLKKLPAVLMPSLPNLTFINLENNDNLKIPPLSVCKRGVKAIFNFMNESDTKKTIYHRLVSLGNVKAGKSSLTKTLIQGTSFLSADVDRTIVLDQSLWTPEENVSLQVYDFGGSEWYHIVQHFFLEKNSLVLLIVNLYDYCDERYIDCVEKWLKIIRARAPSAKLFVVGTHTDMLTNQEVESRQTSIVDLMHEREKCEVEHIRKEIERLRRQGPEAENAATRLELSLQNRVKLPDHVYAISSKTLQNVDRLRSDILLTAKDSGGDIPTTWFLLYKALHSSELAKSKSFLTMEEVAYLDRKAKGNFQARHAFSPTLYRKQTAFFTFQISEDVSGTALNSSTKGKASRKISEQPIQSSQQRPLTTENEENSFRRRIGTLGTAEKRQTRETRAPSEPRLENILSFFHSIGDVLWYEENQEISNFVFHKQLFVINLLKEIFSHSPERIAKTSGNLRRAATCKSTQQALDDLRRKGIMSIRLLKGMLQHLKLDDKLVEAIVQLLIHFGLCFVEEYEDDRIAKLHFPWFLDKKEPREASAMLIELPRIGNQRFILEFDFPLGTPSALFGTTSVRVHGIVHDEASLKHWENGVYARLQHSMILLHRSQSDDAETISFIVEGRNTDELWKILIKLHETFTSLLGHWPGVLQESWLVCPHCTSRGISNPYRFKGENITKCCPDGEEHVTCPNDDVDGGVPVNLIYPMRASNGDVSEQHKLTVAKMIGKYWRPLGRALGLDEYELENIDYDYRMLQEKSYQVLRRWKEDKGCKANLNRLVQALSTMEPKQQHIVDELLQKKMNQEESSASASPNLSLLNKTF